MKRTYFKDVVVILVGTLLIVGISYALPSGYNVQTVTTSLSEQ